MKDTINCPYCQAEEKGCSENWGMGNEGWEHLLEIHQHKHQGNWVITEPKFEILQEELNKIYPKCS